MTCKQGPRPLLRRCQKSASVNPSEEACVSYRDHVLITVSVQSQHALVMSMISVQALRKILLTADHWRISEAYVSEYYS